MSMKFSLDQGPKISVRIIVENRIIQSVELSLTDRFTVHANEDSREIYAWCHSYSSGQQPNIELFLNLENLTDFRKKVILQMSKPTLSR